MKRSVYLIIIALLALLPVSAHAQLSVGAGYMNSNLIEKTGSLSSGFDFNGFYAEAEYGFEIIDNFLGIAPGLRYSFSSSNAIDDLGIDGRWSEQYLDVPVTLDLGFSFSERFRLFAFAGPIFSFGLSSKLSVSGVNQKLDMYEFFDEFLEDHGASYGRFDLMIGFGVGAEFDSFRIKAQFDQGILNRIAGIEDSSTHRNLVKIGVAYVF